MIMNVMIIQKTINNSNNTIAIVIISPTILHQTVLFAMAA